MKARWSLSLVLLCAAVAHAGEPRPLTVEDVLTLASERAPGVLSADVSARVAKHDLLAALGAFDPTLTWDARYDLSTSKQRFGQIPDPFQIRADSWSTGVNVGGTAPTGTSVALDARFTESHTRINLDNVSPALAALFGDGDVQASYRPQFSLTLGQDLLRGVRLAYNLQGVRRAHEGIDVAQLEVEVARQQAVADAAAAYWTWVKLSRSADIARRAVGIAEENLRVGSARVEAGQVAPVEQSRLETAVVEAQATAIDADHAAAQAADTLLLLLGEDPAVDIVPGSVPGDAPPLALDVDVIVVSALEGSLELAAQRKRVEAARLAHRDARHAVLPSLRVDANAGLSGFDDTRWADAFTLGESLFPDVGVGGTLSVPLGFRASVGAARRAEEEVVRQEVLLSQQEARLRADVAQQVRVLQAAATRIQLADRQVELARQTLAAETALHDAGRTLLQDQLEAQASLDRAEADAIGARTDFRTAEITLRRLVGTLDVPR